MHDPRINLNKRNDETEGRIRIAEYLHKPLFIAAGAYGYTSVDEERPEVSSGSYSTYGDSLRGLRPAKLARAIAYALNHVWRRGLLFGLRTPDESFGFHPVPHFCPQTSGGVIVAHIRTHSGTEETAAVTVKRSGLPEHHAYSTHLITWDTRDEDYPDWCNASQGHYDMPYSAATRDMCRRAGILTDTEAAQ